MGARCPLVSEIHGLTRTQRTPGVDVQADRWLRSRQSSSALERTRRLRSSKRQHLERAPISRAVRHEGWGSRTALALYRSKVRPTVYAPSKRRGPVSESV